MALQVPFDIRVPLRERRSYLHSTNLFDFLVAQTRSERELSLTFRRKIEHEVEAISAAEYGDSESYPARFSGVAATGKVDLLLAEKHPLVPLHHREPYNENRVADGSRIEKSEIFSDQDNGASAIERIVALNKKMLCQITEGRKVLLFSKISLGFVPDHKSKLKIVLKSRLGLTLFRSAIFTGEQYAGDILFYGN